MGEQVRNRERDAVGYEQVRYGVGGPENELDDL